MWKNFKKKNKNKPASDTFFLRVPVSTISVLLDAHKAGT
jgi:hypothetical protein